MNQNTQKKLHDRVLQHKDELVQLVSRLIQINSENPCGTQDEVIAFVRQYLEGYGIETQQIDTIPGHPIVTAELGNRAGYNLVLNGHVDVVPIGDPKGWKFDPCGGEVTETTIRGRGTSDMKAGVACLLFVMRLLKESGAKLGGCVRLHIVSDEEAGGKGTRWLCDNGYADGAQACLIAEPTSYDNIEIGQKGGLHLKLIAHGTPAHGSLGNYKGDNAILKLGRVLQHVNELTAVPGHYAENQKQALANSRLICERANSNGAADAIDHLTCNPGIITGGNKINMVPDYCECLCDCRLPIGIRHEDIEAAVKKMIADSGETGIEYVLEYHSEANFTDYDAPIVRMVHKNAEAIWGRTVLPAYQWASSDAKYYRNLGIQTIQYGPANCEGIHGYNEDVDIEDVIHAAEIYMLSFCELLDVE